MERPGKLDHKIGTKIRMGLAMVLGAVAAMSLLSGDTGQSGPPPDCAGTKIVVGGLRPGEYVTTCIESTVQKGELKYPTDIIIP
jgi:hypothetical protein